MFDVVSKKLGSCEGPCKASNTNLLGLVGSSTGGGDGVIILDLQTLSSTGDGTEHAKPPRRSRVSAIRGIGNGFEARDSHVVIVGQVKGLRRRSVASGQSEEDEV
jgi:hypothetical protein